MDKIDHIKVHQDHKAWESDIIMWQQDIKMWNQEADALQLALDYITAAVDKHVKGITEHESKIVSHREKLNRHELDLKYMDEGKLPEVRHKHQEEAEIHLRQYEKHELLKRYHHKIMVLTKSLKETLEGIN